MSHAYIDNLQLPDKYKEKPKRKPPLYLNLSDFKLLVDIIDDFEERCKYQEAQLTVEEIEIRLKIQTIISYIEKARAKKS